MCRSDFVYCSPGSWFPRLSEDSGQAEAERRLGPGGAFVINCSRAGTGRGEDWIYNIKHRPGAECRDGVLVTAPSHHRDIDCVHCPLVFLVPISSWYIEDLPFLRHVCSKFSLPNFAFNTW